MLIGVFQVDSFIIDTEEQDPSLGSNFLLSQRVEGANLHTLTVDAETNVKLEALLEAAGKTHTYLSACSLYTANILKQFQK